MLNFRRFRSTNPKSRSAQDLDLALRLFGRGLSFAKIGQAVRTANKRAGLSCSQARQMVLKRLRYYGFIEHMDRVTNTPVLRAQVRFALEVVPEVQRAVRMRCGKSDFMDRAVEIQRITGDWTPL
jgi:hypothetical protein